jgi:hypothetical protein
VAREALEKKHPLIERVAVDESACRSARVPPHGTQRLKVLRPDGSEIALHGAARSGRSGLRAALPRDNGLRPARGGSQQDYKNEFFHLISHRVVEVEP